MNIFDYMHDVGRPIAYYPRMARFFGSVNASIMFSQLFYWQERTDNDLGVYKTADEWTEETGLSYREQVTARTHLVKQGFLIETNKRLEHRIYYKLNRDAICKAFDLWRNGAQSANDDREIPERRKRSSGTTKAQSGESGKRSSGATKAQSVNRTETTTETTSDTHPPALNSAVAATVFPPLDDAVADTQIRGEAKEVNRKRAAAVGSDNGETALQAACRQTWVAYSAAYAARYGVAPLRNAKVNAAIKGFVQRIGHDEASAVAGFFVERVADPLVVRRMHDTSLLLANAEAYRTQWVTGRTPMPAPTHGHNKHSAAAKAIFDDGFPAY